MQLLDEDYRLWIQGIGRGEGEDTEFREEEGSAALARVLRFSLQFFDALCVRLEPL
jgi:hypothetical protein